MRRSTKTVPIKVICESCIQSINTQCLFCRGQRFYLWDPTTLLCYAADGTQITVTNEDGDTMPVSREVRSKGGDPKLDVQVMLEYIQLWVGETPVRKWKLTLDENGWNACIWFNRFKKSCVEIGNKSLVTCITRSYKEIIKQNTKKSRS